MPSSAPSKRPEGHANPNSQLPQPQVFRDRYSLHKSPWQELLDQSGDPGFASIAHNLDRVFQNFLCNTVISTREVKPLSETNRRGARSLLSMVARSLPEFIASEQEAHDELDEDGDEDMCNAYFTELEAFYAPYGTGWKPLREAVRAQGIYLVSTLIQNHWITDSIACALIEKCRSFAPEESDSLLSTLLSTRKDYPYPKALRPVVGHDISDPVRLLRKYAHHGVANRSYIFDELAKLLLRGVLPPEWMGTKLWTSWMTRATISLSNEDEDCPAATRLIEAVILSASNVRPVTAAQTPTSKLPVKGKREKTGHSTSTTRAVSTAWETSNIARPCPLQVKDALSNHVISLMAALCGMHISRSRAAEETDCADGTKASFITRYLHIALQRELDSISVVQRPDNTLHQLLRRGCILLATSLVQCNDEILLNNNHYGMVSTASVDECAEVIASHSDMIRELALFVHQAFRCLRKKEDKTEHTSGEIRDMISQLARLANTPALSNLLGRVAAEAAMEFAEATGDPDDHMWAVDVQETAAKKQREEEAVPRTLEEPEKSSQSSGLFYWEDIIGEWVASTPPTKAKPILVQKARRPMRMLSSPVPCISSTDTDSGSPGSDRFHDSVSSLTSSPLPMAMATKRTLEATEVSSIRPRKRQRPTPVAVVDKGENIPQNCSTMSTRYDPIVGLVTHRDILRERSTNLTRRMTPVTQQARKVEVVIVNHKESSPRQPMARPHSERAVKQVHRTVERRRSTRPPISTMGGIVEPSKPRQMVNAYYQDSDSDDELCFF